MVYLDNAAATRPAPEVVRAVARASEELYANASSAHRLGSAAARAIEDARAQVAALIAAKPSEVVFTSGGTEANALAVLGAARAARGRHVVATAVEHVSVLRNVERLGREGFEVTLVRPTKAGVVSPEAVAEALRPDTALVAVMLVNNELGTVQPVEAIARELRVRAPKAHLHVDAVQALPLGRIDVRTLGAATLTLSGQKLHGPKGTGALWVRAGAQVTPLWDGGGQERGLRSGTEHLPGVVGLGVACALTQKALAAAEDAAVTARRQRLERLVGELVPDATPTVPAEAARAPHIASFVLPNLPAEPLLHALEAHEVFASAGSACAAKQRKPSHVLAAVGVPEDAAVLRFSLSRETTDLEIETAARALASAVAEVAPFARLAQRGRNRRRG